MHPDPHCTILGILDDGWAGLSGTAQAALAGAALVVGAQRTLDLIASRLAEGAVCRALDGQLSSVPGWVAAALAAGQSVVVLATGDPLCHGIASYLLGKIGGERCTVLPAPSTIQLACARLKRPWQDLRIVSIHAKDAGEWASGAEPEHGLYALVRAAGEHDRLAVLTSPANSPERIARALLAAGHGEEFRLSVAAHLCLADEQVWRDLGLEQAAAMSFPDPNVVILERACWAEAQATSGTAARSDTVGRASARHPAPSDRRFGFEDADFIQRTPEKGLITKLEARAVSLAKLRLGADAIVWDIGAGSGSVGLEASRLANRGHVWAIEKNEGDAANARANAARLRAHNYTLVHGKAPAGLDAWPDPDAVFIGGSGGELAELIALILARLKPGGRLVMNFVTLENLAVATTALAALGASWEVTQLQASRSQPILDMHRLAAQNPVWIVCADAHEGRTRPSLPLQGGGQEGDGAEKPKDLAGSTPWLPHPHPTPAVSLPLRRSTGGEQCSQKPLSYPLEGVGEQLHAEAQNIGANALGKENP